MSVCALRCRFDVSMQHAQTMWAFTSNAELACAYDYIWQGYYNAGAISQAPMRADIMVSAMDLQTAVDLHLKTLRGPDGLLYPVSSNMRMLTSIVWPQNCELRLHLLRPTMALLPAAVRELCNVALGGLCRQCHSSCRFTWLVHAAPIKGHPCVQMWS
jgi:hypothetical protein